MFADEFRANPDPCVRLTGMLQQQLYLSFAPEDAERVRIIRSVLEAAGIAVIAGKADAVTDADLVLACFIRDATGAFHHNSAELDALRGGGSLARTRFETDELLTGKDLRVQNAEHHGEPGRINAEMEFRGKRTVVDGSLVIGNVKTHRS